MSKSKYVWVRLRSYPNSRYSCDAAKHIINVFRVKSSCWDWSITDKNYKSLQGGVAAPSRAQAKSQAISFLENHLKSKIPTKNKPDTKLHTYHHGHYTATVSEEEAFLWRWTVSHKDVALATGRSKSREETVARCREMIRTLIKQSKPKNKAKQDIIWSISTCPTTHTATAHGHVLKVIEVGPFNWRWEILKEGKIIASGKNINFLANAKLCAVAAAEGRNAQEKCEDEHSWEYNQHEMLYTCQHGGLYLSLHIALSKWVWYVQDSTRTSVLASGTSKTIEQAKEKVTKKAIAILARKTKEQATLFYVVYSNGLYLGTRIQWFSDIKQAEQFVTVKDAEAAMQKYAATAGRTAAEVCIIKTYSTQIVEARKYALRTNPTFILDKS